MEDKARLGEVVEVASSLLNGVAWVSLLGISDLHKSYWKSQCKGPEAGRRVPAWFWKSILVWLSWREGGSCGDEV